MEHSDLLFRAALSLALGLIVGFQRERSGPSVGGIRTFPLIALSGFFSSLLSSQYGAWVLGGAVVALSLLFLIGFLKGQEIHEVDVGITTDVAGLLVFLIGAYLATGQFIEIGIIAGGATALLLYLKQPLHGFVTQLQAKDIRAVMQFVLIALVILPLLPDQAYDSYEVLNPRKIWMIVVLITGISLISYAIQRAMGARSGAILSGTLGGLISSTATTLTYSRRARSGDQNSSSTSLVALAIVIASTSALVRMLAEILLVAPSVFMGVAPPLLGMLVVMVITSLIAYSRSKTEPASIPTPANPSELKAALIFGLLYALILYASAAAKALFGTKGLYTVALITGLVDVDAITISTAQLMERGQLSSPDGWRVMLTAALSNLAFKASIAAYIGRHTLIWRVPLYFGMAILGGLGILFLWPTE